jgi:hypothetical protein
MPDETVPSRPEDESGQSTPPMADLLGEVLAEIAAIKEYASYLVSLIIDETKLKARRAIFFLIIALLGAIVGITLIITFAIVLVLGLDGALAAGLGSHWGGHLVTGLLGLGLPALGIALYWRRQNRSHRDEVVRKYEQRKQTQHEQFGEDVDEAARAAA